jgi:hypothetical protein
MSPKVPECPSCQLAVLPRKENPHFPFCSPRCRAIDLGRWLGGEYRIPVSSPDEDDDGDTRPEKPSFDA